MYGVRGHKMVVLVFDLFCQRIGAKKIRCWRLECGVSGGKEERR